MPVALSDLEHEAVIGEGAFAQVKRYRHRRTGERLAVKMPKHEASALRRFVREVELTTSLSGHPNVVEVLGHDVAAPSPHYIMPLAIANLGTFVRKHHASMSPSTRVGVFREICSAISHAHARAVLHRDLCPSNVLVYGLIDAPSIRVADFGLGHDTNSDSDRASSLASNLGHADYIAPEQAARLSDATTLSDIYSLGRLLHFIETGRSPLSPEQHRFSFVYRRATRERASERYASVAQLVEAFEDHVRLEDVPATSVDLSSLRGASPTLGWPSFHLAATSESSIFHPYGSFLEPVTAYLSAPGRLAAYVQAVGPQFAEFVLHYVSMLERCTSLTGWPFSAMNWFGHFLAECFVKAGNEEAELAALEGLWHLAYENDQWDVQTTFRLLVRQGAIRADHDGALAGIILERGCRVGRGHFEGLPLPPRSRAALEQVFAREG